MNTYGRSQELSIGKLKRRDTSLIKERDREGGLITFQDLYNRRESLRTSAPFLLFDRKILVLSIESSRLIFT